MRHLLSLSLLSMILSAAPVALANPDIPPHSVNGTIEFVICGELDPFELGDSCILYGKDRSGSEFGLVTLGLGLVDVYGYDTLDTLAGQPLLLQSDSLQTLSDTAVLTVLNRLPFSETEGRVFFWWDGNGILGN